MNYQDAMELLSQCGLGAVLISAEGEIITINKTGQLLLHGHGELRKKRLADLAEALCPNGEKPRYANVAFGKYLLRCPSPTLSDLSDGTQLVVFRDATNDAKQDMMNNVLNKLSESVVLCDAQDRMLFFNETAAKMDEVVAEEALGEKSQNLYQTLDSKELALPQVIQTKKPLLNYRVHYTTRYGRDVDSVSHTFPIFRNGQFLGAFNIQEDWNAIDNLHSQIISLQEKLRAVTSVSKPIQRSPLSANYQFSDIIHSSDLMKNVVAKCEQVSRSDSSVMLYGETGTGKELFAQSIHNASKRANAPFLAINCAALPENLLEGLLFGTEKGAYTGAERRVGLFEQANNGTLLLDELNSMNINLQSKLLRFLQDGVIRRVGGLSEIHVNVRVLSNINIPPYQAIAENKLRRDLFYRLGVVNINIPPLRERPEDISLLSNVFIQKYNHILGKRVIGIDGDVLEYFRAYSWPGNVRELQHAIEHAMNILPEGCVRITTAYIPEHIVYGWERTAFLSEPVMEPFKQECDTLNDAIQDAGYRAVYNALRKNNGNITKAAQSLQMSRQSMQYRIRRYQIDLHSLRKDNES